MLNNIKGIIFDLDGTLLDTIEDLKDTVNVVLKEFGYPERTLEQIRNSIGYGVQHLFASSLPGGKENPVFEKAFARVQEEYILHSNKKTKPYDGIYRMLEELKNRNIKCAVVSNKPDFVVQEIMPLYFPETFIYSSGERQGINRKPAPDLVYEALNALGLQKEEAVYAGDSDTDILTARNAGMECISCAWGFRTLEELKAAGATILINSPLELPALFC